MARCYIKQFWERRDVCGVVCILGCQLYVEFEAKGSFCSEELELSLLI